MKNIFVECQKYFKITRKNIFLHLETSMIEISKKENNKGAKEKKYIYLYLSFDKKNLKYFES